MNSPLTKSQLCWTIIRLVGLFFILRAVLSLVALIASISAGNSQGFVVFGLFSVLIPLVFGIYLLRSGLFIHRCLMGEPRQSDDFQPKTTPSEDFEWKAIGPQKRTAKPDPETTLTPNETRMIKQWLEENPQFQSRPQADQIALFRDAQRESPELRDD